MKIKNWLKRFLVSSEVEELRKGLDEIKEMTKIGFSGFQNIEDITAGWPIGVAKNVDGNDTMLIAKNRDKIVFVTRIPVGHGFPVHWHHREEICEVIHGCMTDKILDIGIIKKGEKVVYEPYKKHKPMNGCPDSTCVVLVTFQL